MLESLQEEVVIQRNTGRSEEDVGGQGCHELLKSTPETDDSHPTENREGQG